MSKLIYSLFEKKPQKFLHIVMYTIKGYSFINFVAINFIEYNAV